MLLLAGVALHALRGLLSQVSYGSITAEMMATPWSHLLMAVLATALSYLALAGYDASGLRYAGASVRGGTVLLTSFIAHALGNTIGLGVLTGGAVRLRLYTAAGVNAAQVAQVVGFAATSFGLGMTVFGALGVLWAAPAVADPLGAPAWVLRSVAALVLLLVGAVVVLCRSRRSLAIFRTWQLPLPPLDLTLKQLLIALADLSAAAAALWFLLPDGAVGLPSFVAFYAIGIALGVLSHVPGGLGVFEAVILLACAGRAPPEQVAGALLLYRAIYHLLPLMIAAALLGYHEAHAVVSGAVRQAAVRLSPMVLAALTLITGTVLLVSGVTPATDDAAEMLAAHVPLVIVEASHLIGSVAGLALLFVAHGLLQRLDAAWWAALGLSIIAAILALPKGFALSETVLLISLASLLLISRKQFDRRSALLADTFEPGWWVCIAAVLGACAWILLFAYQDVDYADRMWWQFAFDAHAPRSLRALMAVTMTALAFGLWQLFREPRGEAEPPSLAGLDRAAAIVRAQPGAKACLALMGDKSLLFSESEQAFIMYGLRGRSWVSLYDPIGPQQEWPELIWRFVELAHEHGGRAAFYLVRPESLSLYLDAGLRVYKLGEHAHVPLADFSLAGSRRANLRHGVTRAEREGASFEVIAPDAVQAVLAELREVSDLWLASNETREKSFSLGAFEDGYLRRLPVALVRHEGRIVAFATLLCTDVKFDASVDLMRHRPDAPKGTMDYLFAKLMLYCKDEGYQRFGLGMAPMSGMADHRLATRWHRFGRLVFEHGERFYNFRGLRSFKEKFDPVWEARYLAAPGGVDHLLALSDIAALISGGVRGLAGR